MLLVKQRLIHPILRYICTMNGNEKKKRERIKKEEELTNSSSINRMRERERKKRTNFMDFTLEIKAAAAAVT